MSTDDTQRPASVSNVSQETIDALNSATTRLYELLRAGENPGSSAEADRALTELKRLAESRLVYDPDTETWKER
jgi:hypothetical protein